MIYKPVNTAIRLYLNHRFRRIEEMREEGSIVQKTVLDEIWQKAQKTSYIRTFGATSLRDLPVIEYEDIRPSITQMMDGQEDVLWPGVVNWYSKSSGTTGDRSKYLPITDDLLYNNIISSSWDTMSIIYSHWKEANVFEAKSLIMGGSLSDYPGRSGVVVGDVSAIMIKRMPAVGRPFYAPDFEIALMQNWDEKIQQILETTLKEDVVMFGGVPTWNIVLFDKILEFTGKKNILEVWPNLRVYLHGGVSFAPYRNIFQEYLPSEDFMYQEVYNASEGYFAIQDEHEDGMLLLLNNGIYYEFIPLDMMDNLYEHIVPIEQVELGREYVIVVTTLGGLYRYMPGDTIHFVSLRPYRIKVSGRTAQYINCFGEEVMVSNTDKALDMTCAGSEVRVKEYTVAPLFVENQQKAGHQWLIEFERAPMDILQFAQTLDTNLRAVNSDYDAKRYKDMALQNLQIVTLQKGTFIRWMEQKGKLGGQHKVPRLANSRKYVEEILELIDG